jgi:hypothetical protein
MYVYLFTKSKQHQQQPPEAQNTFSIDGFADLYLA